MSEVQKAGADTLMTVPVSTKKHIDVTISSREKFLKKVFCISGKTILVIHEQLVERLGINEETWFEEELVKNGILLRAVSWSDKEEVEGKIDN